MDFVVGQEFEEDLSGVDDRKCMVSKLSRQNTLKLESLKAQLYILFYYKVLLKKTLMLFIKLCFLAQYELAGLYV